MIGALFSGVTRVRRKVVHRLEIHECMSMFMRQSILFIVSILVVTVVTGIISVNARIPNPLIMVLAPRIQPSIRLACSLDSPMNVSMLGRFQWESQEYITLILTKKLAAVSPCHSHQLLLTARVVGEVGCYIIDFATKS